MSSRAVGLSLAWLTCLLLYRSVFEWRGDKQPHFVAIFSTLTAMDGGTKSTNVHDLFRWARRLTHKRVICCPTHSCGPTAVTPLKWFTFKSIDSAGFYLQS